MQSVFVFFLFGVGVIVGSFLNVLSLRFKTGRSVTYGRSVCLTCGEQIRNKDLMPLVSYFMMGGRCRNCASPVSIQYPLVEIFTGVLFALTAVVFWERNLTGQALFWAVLTAFLLVLSILIFIAIYDLRHQIIPDEAVYLFIGLSAILLFIDMNSVKFAFPGTLNLLAGPILFLPFWALWFWSKGRWMGLGDGKLAWGFGWILGFYGGLSAVVLAFWIGAIWAIAVLLWQTLERKTGRLSSKGLSMKSEIPFAPFLIVGFLLVLFSGWTLLDFVFLTF